MTEETTVHLKPTLLTDDEEEELRNLKLLIANRQESVSSTACDTDIPYFASRFMVKDIPQVEGVTFKKQTLPYDCGQTALEMAGLTDEAARIGRENGRMLNTEDMWRLADQGQFKFHQNPQDSLAPQVVLNSYSTGQNHWIVEAGGFVFDPARGVMKKGDYQRTFNPKALAAFEKRPQAQSSSLPIAA